MIPFERELAPKLKDMPFALVSLSADEQKETLTSFLAQEPMPWVNWLSADRRIGPIADYQVRLFPTVFVLDVEGVIRYKQLRE